MTDWEEVIRRHGPAGWRTAYRLMGNDADASDCLQDALLAAVGIARRKGIHNWPGLLRRLVTVYGLRRLRQRYRHRRLHEEASDPDSMASDLNSPDTQAQERETVEHMRKLVARLPGQQAEAFCLHHLEDMSYELIGQQLGIKVSHVGVLLHRARTQLAEIWPATTKHQV